jgi:hypothetical protein
VKPLAGLNLSYVTAPLKPAKKGEEAYMNVKRTQVVEIMAISFGMKAKTRENF